MKPKPIDVSKLEPVWVAPERAAVARQLRDFLERYPRLEIRAGRLRLKAEPRQNQQKAG